MFVVPLTKEPIQIIGDAPSELEIENIIAMPHCWLLKGMEHTIATMNRINAFNDNSVNIGCARDHMDPRTGEINSKWLGRADLYPDKLIRGAKLFDFVSAARINTEPSFLFGYDNIEEVQELPLDTARTFCALHIIGKREDNPHQPQYSYLSTYYAPHYKELDIEIKRIGSEEYNSLLFIPLYPIYEIFDLLPRVVSNNELKKYNLC